MNFAKCFFTTMAFVKRSMGVVMGIFDSFLGLFGMFNILTKTNSNPKFYIRYVDDIY